MSDTILTTSAPSTDSGEMGAGVAEHYGSRQPSAAERLYGAPDLGTPDLGTPDDGSPDHDRFDDGSEDDRLDNGPDDGQPDDADAADPGESEQDTGPPEHYDAFEVPDGMSFDEQMMEAEIIPLFKSLNLSQEQAQRLVDHQANQQQKHMQQTEGYWRQQAETWKQALRADPEIGGARHDESIAAARKAMQAFGTPELDKALSIFELGNHPEMVRLMARIGARLQPDGAVVPGASYHSGRTDPARLLYPDMN
ncbi:MAG: hypothetical protein HQL53_07840 [Magnetococcales bacterium]|nr:hypothetical protein [Magnetococcales bacterium]